MPARKIIPNNICEQCGKPYRPRPDRAHKIRFCNKTCFYKWKRNDALATAKARTEKKCGSCGTIKPLTEFCSYVKYGYRYPFTNCAKCSAAQQRAQRAARGVFSRYSLRPYVDTHGKTVKLCFPCGQTKSREEFGTRLGKIASSCKPCTRAAAKAHYNPKKALQKNAVRRAKQLKATVEFVDRDTVIKRDNSICYLCGHRVKRSDIHLDHVVPLSRGGSHTYGNLRVSHSSCNHRKKDKLLSELDWVTHPTNTALDIIA